MATSRIRAAPIKSLTPRAVAPAMLALVLLAAWPAAAESETPEGPCLDHAEMSRLLDARFAETPAAIGLTSSGGLVELFRTKTGSTWSLILTTPHGRSCLLSSGSSWRPRRTLIAGTPT